ncbi:MAG: hypothetical protein L0Z49_10545 [Actinobacteria bacterium]|nr:hypothetical protein [Actinomycetota bacterium]MCI0544866.1 hypothetical protein [Actinomycetota bacterium]MCI0677803.1 hypothetical protein [Actinomycetota bacterium]
MSHAEHDDHDALVRAVARGVAIGIPLAIVALTLVVWGITDLDLGDSFATGLLPGVLLGGFAGGFAGVASTMD